MRRATLLIAVAIAGCATMPGEARPIAGLGQVARVDGIRIRPLSVIEDSRCPINAMCVWAGRIIVRTEIRSGGRRQNRDLELGKAVRIAGGALTLRSVEPSKIAGEETHPGAYRFTFRFER